MVHLVFIAQDLLESTELAGNDYGTSRKLVNELLKEKNVLMNLSVERAAQLKKNMPEAVCVYLEPSTADLLRERYAKTARNAFELAARMDLAKEQRKLSTFCDYRIASDDIHETHQVSSPVVLRVPTHRGSCVRALAGACLRPAE